MWKKIAILIPFSRGEEENVKKIVKKIENELKIKYYKIFMVGPSTIGKIKNLHFIKEKVRRGKNFWINYFIKKIRRKNYDIFFIINGDVLPQKGLFTRTIRHFKSNNVGMVCYRVIPKKYKGLTSKLFELQWMLCDEISSIQPKASEAIAVRPNLIKNFRSKIVTDEPYIESNIINGGKKVVYDKKIKIINYPPKLLSEFIYQRVRNHIGHLQVYKETGYKVASINYIYLTKSLLSLIKKRPMDLHYLLIFCIIEMIARIYARVLFYKGELPYKWKLAKSCRNI